MPFLSAAVNTTNLPHSSNINIAEKSASKSSQINAATVASWTVKLLGSFNVRQLDSDTISSKMDSLLEGSAPNEVRLTISSATINIHRLLGEDGDVYHSSSPASTLSPLLFTHPLRKIVCVVGREELAQFAYIAREAATMPSASPTSPKTVSAARRNRKTCYAFQARSSQEVGMIQNALAKAFDRIHSRSRMITSPTAPMARVQSPPLAASAADRSTGRGRRKRRAMSATPSRPRPPTATTTPPPPRSSVQGGARSWLKSADSTSVFQRLFRTPQPIEAKCETPVRFRTPLARYPTSAVTPNTATNSQLHHAECNATGSSVKKRRPLSALFGSAFLQRLSYASMTAFGVGGTPKRSQKRIDRREVVAMEECSPCSPRAYASDERPPQLRVSPIYKQCSHLAAGGNGRPKVKRPKPASLIFDEKLAEWIYPIDDCIVVEELEGLPYFTSTLSKEEMMSRLRQMPEGSFILRLSGSRRRCLALSIRVNDRRTQGGVSHYLIVKNENGYRIKGSKHYFPTLPMLVTHHTVIREQLPCQLIFTDWRTQATVDSPELNSTPFAKYPSSSAGVEEIEHVVDL